MPTLLTKILKISRPRFWLYLGGTFALGYALGLKNLSQINSFEFVVFFLFFLIPANFFLYGVNDYFDKEIDIANPKKDEKEYVFTKSDKNMLLLGILITFIIGTFLTIISTELIQTLFLLFFLLSFFYSAPPIRFKNVPFLDGISNGLYIIPGLIGFALTQNTLPNYLIFIAGISWTASMHLFSAIVDIEADKKSNVKTTAVILGFEKAIILCIIYWLIFCASIFKLTGINILSTTLTIYPLVSIYALFNKDKINNIYWKFPYINNILGFGAFLYIIFGLISK